MSDHAVLDISLDFNFCNISQKSKPHYSRGNYDVLEQLCKCDWLTLLNTVSNDVESMWTLFKKSYWRLQQLVYHKQVILAYSKNQNGKGH